MLPRRRIAIATLFGLILGATLLTAQSGPALRPYYLLGAATTNATIVAGCRQTNLYSAEVFNISTSNVFVRFYDRCMTPDETHTPVLVLVIPAGMGTTASQVGYTSFRPGQPVRFVTGMSFRTTVGIAVNSTTAIAASSVVINLTYAN